MEQLKSELQGVQQQLKGLWQKTHQQELQQQQQHLKDGRTKEVPQQPEGSEYQQHPVPQDHTTVCHLMMMMMVVVILDQCKCKARIRGSALP